MDIVLNVDLKDLDLNETIGGYYEEDGGDVRGGSTVAGAVVAKLVEQATKGDYYSSLKIRVEEIRDEAILAALEPIIAEALAKPLVKTNSYGEQVGPETTLRDLIMERVRKTLGISTEETYRNGRYERSTTLEKLVRTQVDAAIKEEVAEAVKAAKDAVPAQLGASIGDTVASAVRDALAKKR
jgi:hypothetical protein